MMPPQNFRTLFRFAVVVALFVLAAIPAGAHHGAGATFAAPQPPESDAPLVAADGIVNELRVENRVSGVTTRYLWLRLDNGSTAALRGSSLDALIPGQRVEVTGRSAGETLFVTGARTLSTVPAKATNASAPLARSVQGSLAVAHADYFNEGRGEYSVHVISEDGKATVLQLAVVPDVLQIGMSVIAEGTLSADGVSLQANRITVLALPAAANDPLQAPITNNVLVILIKFTDSPAADPFTQAQVDQVMRTNAGSVANYYNEVSYGQQLLDVTVTNWLPAGAATPASCGYSSVGSLANTAATAAGYNLADFKNKFYVMPYNATCGWAGLAYVGSPYTAWSNGYNQVGVYGHELGHNFTLLHAGSLGCTGQVIGGSCSVAEYGDPFDMMGSSSTMHFNAMQKLHLSWIPASSVKTHGSGSVIYTLSPLEFGGQSTYAVKIPATANRTYWLEYRQPIGFDAPMSAYPNNGAQIRVATPLQFTNGADDTQILDMTLATPGSFGDAALLVGQTYTDSSYGISVNVISATASVLTLSVSTPGSATCVGNSATNSNWVEHYYVAILHRPSDANGKAFWMGEADRLCALGTDPKQTFVLMANVFFNTPEYLALNRDNNGFVTDLYNAFFSRLPDAAGLSYWVGQLASGMPRNNVMSSFLFSAEFTATMSSSFPGQTARAETYLVLNLYGGLYRRLAETPGYTYWTGQFRTAQCNASPAAAVQATDNSVSSQFLASAEYVARATTNSQYVVDLYYALLQRGAETAGYNYWLGQLNGSLLTREQMRQQFMTSPEMQAQSAAIAAQGCSP